MCAGGAGGGGLGGGAPGILLRPRLPGWVRAWHLAPEGRVPSVPQDPVRAERGSGAQEPLQAAGCGKGGVVTGRGCGSRDVPWGGGQVSAQCPVPAALQTAPHSLWQQPCPTPSERNPPSAGERPSNLGRDPFRLEQKMEASREKKELARGCFTEKGLLIHSGDLGKSSKRVVENQARENAKPGKSTGEGWLWTTHLI